MNFVLLACARQAVLKHSSMTEQPPREIALHGPLRFVIGCLLLLASAAMLLVSDGVGWGVSATTIIPACFLAIPGLSLIKRKVLRLYPEAVEIESGWLWRRCRHVSLLQAQAVVQAQKQVAKQVPKQAEQQAQADLALGDEPDAESNKTVNKTANAALAADLDADPDTGPAVVTPQAGVEIAPMAGMWAVALRCGKQVQPLAVWVTKTQAERIATFLDHAAPDAAWPRLQHQRSEWDR